MRLARQARPSVEPGAHPLGAGVIGRSRKADIAELSI